MVSDFVDSRLEAIRLKLATVEGALSEEMNRNYSVRRQRLMMFLYREKIVLSAVLEELESLAGELKDTGL